MLDDKVDPMPEPYMGVGSFKFADVVRHWGRERLAHEVVVARELARGIIREGLRFQSVDPAWTKTNVALRGYPLVGFSARHDFPPILIRADALEHLLAVARESCDPDPLRLSEEFVTKNDFRKWLVATGRPMPEFWYASRERCADAEPIAQHRTP